MWLPIFPYASDELFRGMYRQQRQTALQRRFIEANPQALSNLLVVDVDHDDALYRCLERKHGWQPNAVVENPANGHAHAVWALQEPVTRTEVASRKPLAFAAAVTEGLRRSVDGDKGYSGLMTKNPVHDDWRDNWFTDRLYSLRELEAHLTEQGFMPPPSWNRTRRKNPVGLGRNCFLFETGRTWAYQEARRIRQRNEYPTAEDHSALRLALDAHVHDLNAEFSEPLPMNEAGHISASWYRWITTRFYGWTDARSVNAATFMNIQSARGRKSAQKRRSWVEARQQKIEVLG